MKVQLEVNVQIRMTVDESLELERELLDAASPHRTHLRKLADALQIQNSTASRLRATGSAG